MLADDKIHLPGGLNLLFLQQSAFHAKWNSMQKAAILISRGRHFSEDHDVLGGWWYQIYDGDDDDYKDD